MPDNSTNNAETAINQPVVQPMQVSEDGNAVEVGYTVADPVGPSAQAEEQSLLAGKFKNQDELVKAYKELEAKLGQGKPDETAQQQEEDRKQQAEEVPEAEKIAGLQTTAEASDMLKEKGLNIQTFAAEFERTGSLSEESYTTLESKGIPRDTVDAYINGQRVLVSAQVKEVKDSVGGEAEYAKLCQWATTGLSKQEQESYERILATNDPTIIKLAAQGLKSRYELEMGKDPSVTIGGNASARNDGIERFASTAEMMSAMRDPRYEADPAYRAKVERKVFNSNF